METNKVMRGDAFVSGIGYSGKYNGKYQSSRCGRGGQGESNQQNTIKAADEFVHLGNGSDTVETSL